MSAWHTLEVDEVARQLGADRERGLAAAEAERRLAEHGPNLFVERGAKSPWRIVWEQITGVLVIVLIIAALVSALLGDLADAVVILLIVILNTVLGFWQEYRAEQAMAALKRLAVPVVRARRDGHLVETSAANLVPGDIVLLAAGNRVHADARIVESASLRVEEAALTGESEPVEKHAQAIPAADAPLPWCRRGPRSQPGTGIGAKAATHGRR